MQNCIASASFKFVLITLSLLCGWSLAQVQPIRIGPNELSANDMMRKISPENKPEGNVGCLKLVQVLVNAIKPEKLGNPDSEFEQRGNPSFLCDSQPQKPRPKTGMTSFRQKLVPKSARNSSSLSARIRQRILQGFLSEPILENTNQL